MKGSRDTERHSRRARLRPDMPVIYSELPAPSFAAEQLRTLAFQIEEAVQAAAAEGGYALAVTSPDPGAGKTLTSLNLALTLAQEGERRVLLVETDLWKPSLSRYLELESPEPGLCQLIEDGGSLKDATVPIWGAGLDLLPAGGQGRVGNLLAHRRMSELIAEMRSLYEIVVLDSPPFVLASGRALASAADGALLVVRAGRTKKKAIEEVLSTLGPAKVVGMALNGTRARNGSGYAYYAYGTPEDVAPVPEPELEAEEAEEPEVDEQPPVESRKRAGIVGAGAALLVIATLGFLWLRPSAGPDGSVPGEEARSGAPAAGATSSSDLQRVLGERIAEGARLAVAEEPIFDDSYVRIDYPGGDPGRQRGSGADLVVRAFRNAGIDLQQLVHEDIARAPAEYGITESDPSIDHRRTRNLNVFFRRNAVTVPADESDWRPGDVVIWVTNRLEIPDRIGIVSDRQATDLRPMVLYHFRADGTFSGKPGEGDLLTMWPVVGHYRWSLDSPRAATAAQPSAPRADAPAPTPAPRRPPAEPAARTAPPAAPEPEPAEAREPAAARPVASEPAPAEAREPAASEPEPATTEAAAEDAPPPSPDEPAGEPDAEGGAEAREAADPQSEEASRPEPPAATEPAAPQTGEPSDPPPAGRSEG